MIIKNAKIYTMSDNIIENGYVVIKADKIVKVGNMSDYDDNKYTGEVIDANGAKLYPGFIDSHTHLGMWEDGLGFEGEDGNEDTDPSTPHMRAIDGVNPVDHCFEEALDSGITSVLTGPGSANTIGGQVIAIKTYGRRIDDMIIKDPCMMKMALGENPKTTYHEKEQSPSTRMATAAIIREQLCKAQRYLEALELAENDSDCDKPEYDAKCEALIPVLKREIPVQFHAHRCDDVFTGIRIAKEFNLRYVIIHATQGYKMADILKQEDVMLMSGPLICDRAKPEMKDLDIKAPAVYEQHGIMFSIITDHPVVPIQHLRTSAALAVAAGLSHYEALKAITINAAKISGIDDRVGAIKAGLDADLVLYDGDALDIMQKPKMVMINGKIVRDRR